eukprot:3116527-Amphidinium_carterae.2
MGRQGRKGRSSGACRCELVLLGQRCAGNEPSKRQGEAHRQVIVNLEAPAAQAFLLQASWHAWLRCIQWTACTHVRRH